MINHRMMDSGLQPRPVYLWDDFYRRQWTSQPAYRMEAGDCGRGPAPHPLREGWKNISSWTVSLSSKSWRSPTITLRTKQTLGNNLVQFLGHRTWKSCQFTSHSMEILEIVLWSSWAINSPWSMMISLKSCLRERGVWADILWLLHSWMHEIVFIGLKW